MDNKNSTLLQLSTFKISPVTNRLMSISKYAFLIVTLILFIAGCKKVYNPEINTNLEILVVEGLITDSNGPNTIKLSKTAPFGSETNKKMVSGAKLQVKNNHDQTYFLTETSYGIYSLPSNFKPVTGDSYALFIQTKNGDRYMSNPQKLLPTPSFDSIHGFVSNKAYLYENQHLDQVQKVINGAYVLLNFQNDNSGLVPKNRFKNQILLEWWGFSQKYKLFGYCWNTVFLDLDENITGPAQTVNGTETENHSLCFLPRDQVYYDLTDSLDKLYNLVLTVQQYNLNDDSYEFYKGANVQLDSDGKIFDPIASQLYGNIKCISDPQKLAFGLFEVSSTQSKTYLIKMDPNSNTVEFAPAQKLNDTIPKEGVRTQIPHFWHG